MQENSNSITHSIQYRTTNYFDYGEEEKYGSNLWVAKSVQGNAYTTIPFIHLKGIATIENNKVKELHSTELFSKNPLGKWEMEIYQNALWIFAKESGNSYRFVNNQLEQITLPPSDGITIETKLNKLLAGRKITIVKALPDNNLWICTYKGIVKFNPQTGEAELFYPQFSFSNCMIDREGNYWFTTLKNGILRVPDFSFNVWNEYNGLTKIANDGTHLFFADNNGKIIRFDRKGKKTQTFHTGYDADVQSFDYDATEKTLWFNVNNQLFKLKGNTIEKTDNFNIQAIKSVQKINGAVFIASSHGIFIDGTQVNKSWAREMKFDSLNRCVWIATNSGLMKCSNDNRGGWMLSDTLFAGTQILSIDFSATENLLYVLTFNGKVYAVNPQNKFSVMVQLPENAQATKLVFYNEQLYLATNKGIATLNLSPDVHRIPKEDVGLNFFNSLSGLVSDNVQDFTISNGCLWIASIKGLQQIPLSRLNTETPRAKIYLRRDVARNVSTEVNLSYNDNLILKPEVSHYSSNGQFEYAYRINKNEWIKLPASIEQIELQNLPTGAIEIELKAIDHKGVDSENTIVLKGFVKPPFYKTWWFVTLCTLVFLAFVFFVFNRQWKKHRQKMQLENEMNVLKLTAVKSQMNPHFIFNVLGSIKGYIYANDRQKATVYLDDFSDLIRTILEKSELHYTLLTDELNTVKLYIELEAMMLNDFSYQINVSETVNTNTVKIPSLILQPYIENAFKHGLRHKQGDKKLLLTVSSNEKNQCVIEITDNGIGRKQAEELNTNNTLKRKSFAISAMQKRMEVINQQNEKQISIEIIDLFDDKDVSTGTRVIIRL